MLTKKQAVKIKKDVELENNSIPLAFAALSDHGRFRIFKMLVKNKGVCVTDVASVLEISMPAASQQLKIMEMSGLVKKERMGQMICYELKYENPLVRSIIKIIRN